MPQVPFQEGGAAVFHLCLRRMRRLGQVHLSRVGGGRSAAELRTPPCLHGARPRSEVPRARFRTSAVPLGLGFSAVYFPPLKWRASLSRAHGAELPSRPEPDEVETGFPRPEGGKAPRPHRSIWLPCTIHLPAAAAFPLSSAVAESISALSFSSTLATRTISALASGQRFCSMASRTPGMVFTP